MKSIIVFGSSGQLACELSDSSKFDKQYQYHFIPREVVDFSSQSEMHNYFNTKLPKDTIGIINAVAYTAVDLAEKEIQIATQVNTITPGVIAENAKKLGIKFIHISTDFVFDGTKSKPYMETDPKNPLSVYGRTKSEGEDIILEQNKEAIIIRTSWVYSKYGKNFLKTILRLSEEKKTISVVDDQIGSPTWAKDLANICIEAVATDKKGIFHFSNEGVCTWYDFAKEIISHLNVNCQIIPIPSENYPTPAKRPSFSVLSKIKFRESFVFQNVHWKERIPVVLNDLKS